MLLFKFDLVAIGFIFLFLFLMKCLMACIFWIGEILEKVSQLTHIRDGQRLNLHAGVSQLIGCAWIRTEKDSEITFRLCG